MRTSKLTPTAFHIHWSALFTAALLSLPYPSRVVVVVSASDADVEGGAANHGVPHEGGSSSDSRQRMHPRSGNDRWNTNESNDGGGGFESLFDNIIRGIDGGNGDGVFLQRGVKLTPRRRRRLLDRHRVGQNGNEKRRGLSDEVDAMVSRMTALHNVFFSSI